MEQTNVTQSLEWTDVQSTKEDIAFIAEPALTIDNNVVNEQEVVKPVQQKKPFKKKFNKTKPASQEQLSALADRFNNKEVKHVRNPVPALLIPGNRPATAALGKVFAGKLNNKSDDGEDGIDHINVSQMGKTELGKFLDINAKAPFNHPELAQFQSVGGLWFYVKTEDHPESFRYIWGDRCRKMGKEYKTIDVDSFKLIIADATWIKIISNPAMVEEMLLSDLPFKNYFYYGALRIKKPTPESLWYCKVLETIRNTLKLRVEINDATLQPDFSFLD
jgi:hypothetical protein